MTKLPSSHDRDPRSTYGDIRRLATVGLLGLAALTPVIPGFTATAAAPNPNISSQQNDIDRLPSAEVRSHLERSRMVLIRRAKHAEPFVAWDVVCNVNRIDLGDEDGKASIAKEIDASGAGHCIASETGAKYGLLKTGDSRPKDYGINNKLFDYGLSVKSNPDGGFTPIGTVTNMVIPPGRDTLYIHAVKADGINGNPFKSVEALVMPTKAQLAKRDKRVGHMVTMSAYTVQSGGVVAGAGRWLGTVKAKWDIKGTPGYTKDDVVQNIDVVGLKGNPSARKDPTNFSASGIKAIDSRGEVLGPLSGRLNVKDARVVDLSNPATEEPSDAEDRKKILSTRDYLAGLLNLNLKPYPAVAYFQEPESVESLRDLKANRGNKPKNN